MTGFAKQMTAGSIVQETCALMGLPVPATVFDAINDKTASQMWALLRNVGRRLCKPTSTYRWSVLTRDFHVVTVPAQTRYALPEDWDSFIDLTGWNYSNRLPMLGPASNPQWQTLRARSIGPTTISVVYRTQAGWFEIYNSPSFAEDLHINYTSRCWVRDVNSTPDAPVFTDAPAVDGDIVLFDPELVVAMLQQAFMTAKGFDTTAISEQVRMQIESAINADSDAPVLNATTADTYPLISTQFNLPDTGYGA
jgi:hypothetical protein